MTDIIVQNGQVACDATGYTDEGNYYSVPGQPNYFWKTLGFTVVDTGAPLPADFSVSVYDWNGTALVRVGDTAAAIMNARTNALSQANSTYLNKIGSYTYDFGTNQALFADGTTGPAGQQSVLMRDYSDNTQRDLDNWALDWITCTKYIRDGAPTTQVQVTASNEAVITLAATDCLTFLEDMLVRGRTLVFFYRGLVNLINQQTTVAGINTTYNSAVWPS